MFSIFKKDNLSISKRLTKENVDKTYSVLLEKYGLQTLDKSDPDYKQNKEKACNYTMEKINEVLANAIEKQSKSEIEFLDRKELRYLYNENFKTCENFKNYEDSLNSIGIKLNVYKTDINPTPMVSVELLEKKVNVYH